MSWYCDIAPGHPFHGPYHDREYGFPLDGDAALFERMALEIFQAGLSWLIVLKKRPAIVTAFEGFDPDRVAAFGPEEVARLLADPGIIRNRLKIAAVIDNAGRIVRIRESHGSLAGWLAAQEARTLPDWVKVMKKQFRFMGPEVVNEFLMSIDYLPGAHRADCPAQASIEAARARRGDGR